MNDTSETKDLSGAEKRALLERLLVEKASRVTTSHPLSHGQQALRFLHQDAPESPAYNVAVVFRILSPVDAAALRAVFQTLIARHASLRSTFSRQDDQPVRIVHGHQEVRFEEIDASMDTEEKLQRRVTQAYRRPFDPEQGPLLRVSLFTRAPEAHVLLIVMHHLVTDGWSDWRLLSELLLLYPAHKAGRSVTLPPLRWQYQDFVRWQTELLASKEGERLWDYWQTQLSGELPVLELSTDRPRPPVQSYQGASVFFRLPEPLTRKLREQAQASGATLYMILLAAFQVLLHRYTGQDDILVGSPAAGRSRGEFEGIVGYFVNPIVLRARLEGDPTFSAFLEQVRQTVLEGLAHQDYPFSLLVERLQPARTSHSPIFQVLFALQKAQQDDDLSALLGAGDESFRVNKNGLLLAPFRMAQQEGQFDLTLEMTEAKPSLSGVFKYNTDLFEAERIERMAGHFVRLLEGIVTAPETEISRLPLLTEVERGRILVEWNDTKVPYPADKCVHELFEEQVVRSPDAVAVVFEDEEVSYGELNARANRLAHRLRALGVGPESLVGLFVERSVEMVVGLLAILKAGGAYVPLDPEYPPERLAFMTEDADLKLLLYQEATKDRLPECSAQTLDMDAEAAVIADESSANPARFGSSDNCAYVIYTSGSTGKPKGVMIEHGMVASHVLNVIALYGLKPEDRVLQFASLNFDASVGQIFGTLVAGATLVPRGAKVWTPEECLHTLLHRGVTVAHMTPSYVQQLLSTAIEHRKELDVSDFRVLNSGGEVLLSTTVQLWREVGLHNGKFLNTYGPTEATVTATAFEISEDWAENADSIPIGKVLPGRTAYILDGHMQPVPIGIGGELYIGGEGVARSYLNRPDLTAERFIPDPFSEDPDARLYRTGDRCRWLPDGNIEFLGRIDTQVKIRGFRIECGEVEHALSAHPGVREAVVDARGEGADKQLVAWVVAASDDQPELRDELRAHLRGLLPDWMVPTGFVFPEALPLTPSGKLDRRALPDPAADELRTGAHYTAPRDPVEETLCGIFAQVLGVSRVGIQDGFFALGGHSLLAIRVVSQVREQLAVELPLRTLFEYPTPAGLAEAIAALAGAEILPPVVAIPRDGPLAASFAQERLWVLDRLEGSENATYSIPFAVRLQGALAVSALSRAISQLVARHESLRTCFAADADGSPKQVILPAGPIPLPTEAVTEAALSARLSAEAARPFELTTGPLFRALLFRTSDAEHVLFLNVHHIVFDGWSGDILQRELGELYNAELAGRPPVLPAASLHYADYAAWQRGWLTGETLARQLDWWREHLAGTPALLELPWDHPRPPLQDFRGGQVPVVIPSHVGRRLAELGRRRGATLFMVLHAAFYVLLARLSGQEDIVVGTPVAGRRHAGLDHMIGLFVNTLALRADLAGDPDFGEVLSQVRERALAAWSHQDVPFERVVDALHPERSLDRTPLFQVLFVLQNTPVGDMPFADLDVEALAIGEGAGLDSAKFDLSLGLEETADGGIKGSLEYASQLFERPTIARWAGHFVRLLEGIVAAPETGISRLPLLTEAEQERILVEWNATATPYPQAKCVHELFEEQAVKKPDAVAVVFEDEKVSYGELNTRANRLAHRLRGLGVGPEILVGLLVERSVEMIVGLLAILKAGGAYVPLDPAYPRERLAFMAEDAELKLLLCHGATRENLPECPARILDLDAEAATIAGESSANPARLGLPDNCAYVIYTSGSTGKPKGVMVEHKSLTNLAHMQMQAFGITPRDRMLQFASLNFDASLEQLFSAFLGGAGLVLRGQQIWTVEECRHQVCRNQVTVAEFPPAYLHQFLEFCLEDEHAASTLPLKQLVTGGEALSDATVGLSRRLGLSLFNTYGPTEATITATNAYLSGDEKITGPIVPIGRPIANVRVYILDRRMQPVPIGIGGELCIGGAGVARGYLNRPDLTAEKFISDPFSEAPDARLYRTGDRCRWLPDGNIEFLGRIDTQVKIRGFRIECGEVEHALSAHPGVREAVVDARGEGADKQLVAWVVAASDDQPELRDELRAHLRGLLPDWMVPTGFVFPEALPLTPSGKLDRRALPDPAADELRTGAHYTAPRDPVEETLCGIFAQVLGVSRVGIQDGFFALGGHSLLAIRVVSQVREQLAVELPLRTLFEYPTPAGLAGAIAALAGAEILPPVVAIPRDGPLAASFAQERLWVLDRLEGSENATYSIPFAVRLQGALAVSALSRAISQLVARHESLRTCFAADADGSPKQVILPAGPIPLPTEAVTEAALSARLSAEAARPFELTTGPLFRALLFRTSDAEHVLFLNVHHIVFDGWSGDILQRELGELYNAELAGRPPVLPAASLHYADYAAWQRGWLTGETLARQLDWWREHLAGAPALLELPWDHPRPPLQDFRGGQVPVVIPSHVGTRLAELGRRRGATLFMVLHAAFYVLLARLSGQEDIVVGTPVAGRRHAGLDHMIGLFVNTLALRADLAGDPDFGEVLSQVRERALAAWSHQDVPFERVVDALHPERSLDRTPLFQVLFVLQNTPVGDMPFADLDVEALAIGEEAGLDSAKFDLSLGLEETADGGIKGSLEYASQLFERPTIARWAGHFVRLLEGIVAAPETQISRLPLLTEVEQARILVEWNDTKAPYPADKCIYELFEEQVAKTPHAVAVVFEDAEVSYTELNARANRLAHRLRALGVGPEILVGLLVERSVEMIVGLLAILKAGGAYVPLDPAYPRERLAFMAEDAELKLLLCHGATRENLPECPARILDLDAEAAAIAGESSDNLVRLGSPDNLAYVIYTSGSTGKPKGVMTQHRGCVNYIIPVIAIYELGDNDTVLQFSSITFDSSVDEIFTCLSSGGRLILRTEKMIGSPQRFLETCRDSGVTVLFLPTSYWHQITSEIAGLMNEPFVIKKKGRAGDGLFSTRPYKKGEMVLKLDGEILDHPTRETVQIGKNKHIRDKSNGVFMNHSCYPNTTIKHDCVIAIRDIRFGDEITFDYCETEDKMSNPFVCDCCNNLIAGKFSAKERTPDPELSDSKTHNFIFSRRLRLVIIGGENALPDRLKVWNTLSGYQKLVNGYGPTEASIAVTFWTFDGTEYIKEEIDEVPIGRPIANMRTYILDQHRQPVPIGVPGELHIAGIGLARGYLNQPELTTEKFIDVELLGKTERVYKTGDLCRWLPDGNIEFLGRIDTQVKIRGFRIECGEVENALSAHPGVREAVVDARGEGADKQLVAWVVAASDDQPELRDELRAHLRGLLPDWMVPTGFVFPEALPLTPSGKLDRRALPDPAADELRTGAHYTAPRDPVEETLCGIFAQVLGVSRVGIQDGFFALGGHSLLAIRVVSQVREQLAVELPLRTLFEYPTPAGLAGAIAALAGAEILPPVVAIPRDGPLAASFAQERLWVLDRLEGSENATYSIPFAVRLQGALAVSALSRAISQLVARHESLRTCFAADADGSPKQVILPAGPIPLPTEAVTEAALSARLSAEAARPFELTTGPLFRALLFRTSDAEHVLFLNVHHIVFDGWSGDILQRELGELYNAELAGHPPVLPAASLHYADYAAWQRGWLTGETLARQLDWWREHLAGAPALLELPWDHPRPPLQDFRGGQVPVVIPSHVGTRLAELGRRRGATLFMVLHAAFYVLLARLSGQEDIVVGTPVAGRRHAGLDHMIGLFVNTLALRADLAGDPDFGEVLSQVRERALAAWSHQDVPFERVVDALHPERSLDRTPLFQVLFVLQNTPVGDMPFADLDVEALAIGEEAGLDSAKFDLSLGLEETATGEIKGSLGYASQLFERPTIARWAGHFVRLLEGIVAAPETGISRLPLLTEAEQERILVEWNATATPYPQAKCVHELFEEQAVKKPDAVAVVFEDEEVSYGELNARANRLAHRLRALGVEPECLVGLLVERSVEMIVGLLAILKAGGAYVPLDPAYPRERLAFMAEDAELKLLLCHGATRENLPECPARILDLDAEAAAIAEENSDNPESLAKPDNCAYIIYTSGSTGKPKGVMIEHRNLSNFLHSMGREPGFSDRDILLSVTTLSFDISGLESFLPLILGGRLVVAGNTDVRDARALIGLMDKHKVTFLQATPITWRLLLIEDWKSCSTVKALCGGEALAGDLANALSRNLPALWNMYGPTETTIWSLVKRILPDEIVSIGRPIANTQVYILSFDLQPVPIGVPGELYIGGAGVARGYLNRPDLTAERFIPDPFSEDPDARLYRTGDRCRWLPDGNIEFLGRIDTQVKIRGFRIECGEVENALSAHPGIREAAVDARGEGVDRQLVAWVVAASDDHPALRDELRAHLRGLLPDWMVPAGFVFPEALPLTASGKIDRRALPDPDPSQRETEQGFVAPRTSIEKALVDIWADVLEHKNIGIHDSFFELGGHSLSATRVIALVRKRVGVELPLRALFEHPTPAGLASAVRGNKEWKPTILFPLNTGDKKAKPPLFCIHPVGGGALCYRDLANCMESDQPVYGIQAVGFEGEAEPLTDIDAMVTRYVEEITTLWPQGPYNLYGWSYGGLIAFEMAHRLRSDDREVALLALGDSPNPLEFEQHLQEPEEDEMLFHILMETSDEKLPLFSELQDWTSAERMGYLRERVMGSECGDLDRFTRIYRANLRALPAGYRPVPWEGKILSLTAAEDEPVATPETRTDAAIWEDFARRIDHHAVPGDHFTMHRPPNVRRIAEILGKYLRIS